MSSPQFEELYIKLEDSSNIAKHVLDNNRVEIEKFLKSNTRDLAELSGKELKHLGRQKRVHNYSRIPKHMLIRKLRDLGL